QLVAEQRRLWTTLIETLAVTIDARDQQTAGHSQRVTRYAEVIGRALGLQGIELEKIRAAALLHDYGKIAVRDQFLLKPGQLDPAVVAAVRRNVHDLEWTLDSMKHTWPKPGDEGMTAAPESGLSERDQAPSS